MVGVSIAVVIAIEGAARLETKVFGVFLKEPHRGKDRGGDAV